MKCPKRQSEHSVKSGLANGNPRRLCKQCGCNYTRSQPRGKPMELKRQAVQMYMKGMGVSNVSVLNWVRAFGERLEPLRAARTPEHTPVIECDELWHFVGKKENCGCGLPLTDSGASRLTLSWVHVKPERGDAFGSASRACAVPNTLLTLGTPTQGSFPKRCLPAQSVKRTQSNHLTPPCVTIWLDSIAKRTVTPRVLVWFEPH